MGEDGEKAIVPKGDPEILDFEFPTKTTWSMHVGENGASSSGSNLRPFFIGMGFLPSLVDEVIEEKGEDNVDLLLETLFAHSARQKVNSESSDSLDSIFDDKGSPPEVSTVKPKEKPAVGVNDDKRSSLLMMNFSVNEVELALSKIGEDAPVNEIVDFIVASQIAKKYEKDTDNPTLNDQVKQEEVDETLFGTTEKTLRLLEMGFSENQISSAIKRFGSEVPVSELADSIFADQIADNSGQKDKYSSTTNGTNSSHSTNIRTSLGMGMEDGRRCHSYNSASVKTENFIPDATSQSRNIRIEETYRGKRPKQEYFDDYPNVASQFRRGGFEEIRKGKKPKEQCADDSNSFLGSTWVEEKVNPKITKFGGSNPFEFKPAKSLDQMLAKPPYFLYGNVVNVSQESWVKISQFLYGVEPEFVNSQFFSAMSRKEGYIHNLPTKNRSYILPKPPMTIEDAIPHTKKWWPSWDTRKQFSCISSETSGTSQLCDRLGRILTSSRGLLSPEQQRDILHQCRTLNLVWVGPSELGPVEPEHLEHILGYPTNHTQAAESSLVERLQSLKHCFQTDTLGYHLSVLKSMFPGGLTMLSIFSGVGGAEVSLHRLGIRLKGVVSVETSETNRKILRRWWDNTGQTGELVQIEDIQKLTSKKLESLTQKLGDFDFVICQSPCTYSSNAKTAAGSDSIAGFDYSLFYESVRVLQRVRSRLERKT